MAGMKDRSFPKPIWTKTGPPPFPDEMLARHIDKYKQLRTGKSGKEIFFEEVHNRKIKGG